MWEKASESILSSKRHLEDKLVLELDSVPGKRERGDITLTSKYTYKNDIKCLFVQGSKNVKAVLASVPNNTAV